MRALVISFLFPNRVHPGYGVFVLNRVRAVSRYCNVAVIAPVQKYLLIAGFLSRPDTRAVPERDNLGGVNAWYPRFSVVPRFLKLLDGLTFWLAVQRALAMADGPGNPAFDVIDIHWTYPDAVAGLALSRRSGRPYIVTLRGHEAFYDTEWSVRRWLVAHALRRADAVVALSDELAQKAIRLGVSPSRVHVIYNGVDTGRFSPAPENERRARVGMPVGQRIVLSVGRLTQAKGHHDVIRAVAALRTRHDIALYIVGGVNPEQDYGPALRELVRDLGLENVHFVENVDHADLPDWYGAADLFCLATRREGCPNVVLESIACGTPVVASAVGSIPEIIEPGVNGTLVQALTPEAFASAIDSALVRPWDRNAVAATMQSWNWDACGRQVRDLYEAVVNKQ